MSIDVLVTGGGTVKSGAASVDPTTVASCSLCGKTSVEASVGIGPDRTACAPCLRERLDALSVARYRLADYGPKSIPWGKVSG